MPAKPVLHSGALGDQIVAVIGQEADLHRLLVQERCREPVHPVFDDRASDRQRVDPVRLPDSPLTAPGLPHHLRRDADHPLTGRDQRLFKTPRDVPAILDRPHSLIAELPGPPQRVEMPAIRGSDLLDRGLPAGALLDRREHVGPLVRVRSDHDH